MDAYGATAIQPFNSAFALRLSPQYRFIRRDTAARAAADMVRARFVIRPTDRLTLRRIPGSFNSGKARSMAMISARSSFSACSAPRRASAFTLSALSFVDFLGIVEVHSSL